MDESGEVHIARGAEQVVDRWFRFFALLPIP